MRSKQSVLIIEDDELLAETLAAQLIEDHHYRVYTAATLATAGRIIDGDSTRIDAVILDLSMPDGDGRDFCYRLRRQGHKMPVIMLTGSDSEADIVSGLEAGANDYIAKPFRISELAARLRAQLRLFEGSDDAAFPIGAFLFRPAQRALYHSSTQRRIRLTNKEAAILKFLYLSNNQSADRQMLAYELWGDSPATMHTLETHVYRLRQKIESDPTRPTMLRTKDKHYCLNPDIAPAIEA
jgi:DNA-binding response OmpR family regulator